MVEQQTLTLYIAVRVRVPQPKIQTPFVGVLIFGFGDNETRTAGSTNSRFCFAKSSRLPRSHHYNGGERVRR